MTEAKTPDEMALMQDLRIAPFRMAEMDGRWGHLPSTDTKWPFAFFWVSAALRVGSPDRFALRLDCSGYPIVAPTGTFWTLDLAQVLPPGQRPKGRDRVARVFRTDWNGGQALYHPFDRATADHAGWPSQYPALVWNRSRTIVDYLEVVHGLLHSEEYTGV